MNALKPRVKITVSVVAINLSISAAHAQGVRFCADRASFEAAAENLALVDLEGIATPGGTVALDSFTEAGAVFATPGAGGVIIADAATTDTFGGPYDSDLILAPSSNDVLTISFPAGTTAVAGNFGGLHAVADLQLTLRGTSGVLANVSAPAAPGFGFGATPHFFGWLAEGDEIESLTISAVFDAADNVQFGAALPRGEGCPPQQVLNSGDIIVADVALHALVHVDPATGEQRIITQNGFLRDPSGVLVDADGSILVADYFFDNQNGYIGRLVRVDPATGFQTMVHLGDPLVGPTGLGRDADGSLLVVDLFGRKLLRFDAGTGEFSEVSSGGFFIAPTDVAVDGEGQIFVVDQNALDGIGAVIRVDRETGAQQAMAICVFADPAGITMDPAGNLVVVDSTAGPLDPEGHITGIIARVDPDSGNATLLPPFGFLGLPWGVTLDNDGQLLVTLQDADEKGVIRVDPVSGEQTEVSLGGVFVRPFGVTVVPPVSLIPCDINGDGLLDMADLGAFVAAILGAPFEPAHVARCDLNGDGLADGADIQPFIACLTGE